MKIEDTIGFTLPLKIVNLIQAFWHFSVKPTYSRFQPSVNLEIFSGKTSALLLLQGLNVAGSEFMHRHAASTFTVVGDSTETTLSCKEGCCLCMCAKAVVWEESQTLKAAKAATAVQRGNKEKSRKEEETLLAQNAQNIFSHQHFFLLLLLCNIQYKTLYCRQYLKSTFCWGKKTILLLSSKKELVCFWILEMLWKMDLRLIEQGFYSFFFGNFFLVRSMPKAI